MRSSRIDRFISRGRAGKPANRKQARGGTAAVEFAVVAPLVFLLLFLPMFEFGRGMMVSELAANAARIGCRMGVLPGNSNSNVTAAVNSALSGPGITGATTTITVNGGTSDVSSAKLGDVIKVTVSVPFNNVSWIPGQFLAGKTLTGVETMRHE
jgi:Flp pilus assembly protein TadG